MKKLARLCARTRHRTNFADLKKKRGIAGIRLFLYLRNVVLKKPEANLSIDSGATLRKKIPNYLVCLTEGGYRVIVLDDWVTIH